MLTDEFIAIVLASMITHVIAARLGYNCGWSRAEDVIFKTAGWKR
jgi:hypothetical protein